MNSTDLSEWCVQLSLGLAHWDISSTYPSAAKTHREITVKAQCPHLEDLSGYFNPILTKELLILIARTDVRTRNYKYLYGLLRTVRPLSSPLADSPLRGSLAGHTQNSYIIISIVEGCMIEQCSH